MSPKWRERLWRVWEIGSSVVLTVLGIVCLLIGVLVYVAAIW